MPTEIDFRTDFLSKFRLKDKTLINPERYELYEGYYTSIVPDHFAHPTPVTKIVLKGTTLVYYDL